MRDIFATMSDYINIKDARGVADFMAKVGLECPVCKELLNKPIHQCEAGHAWCVECDDKFDRCPECRMALDIRIRSLLSERLIAILPVRCKYVPEGCNVAISDGIGQHETVCPFRIVDCPLCDEEIVFKDLLPHIETGHKRNMEQISPPRGLSFFKVQAELLGDTKGPRPVESFGGKLYKVDDVFFSTAVVLRKGHFHVWIYALTARDEAKEFVYTLKFDGLSFNSSIKFTHTDNVISIDHRIKDVMKSGNCLILNANMVKEKIWDPSNDDVLFSVIIEKKTDADGPCPKVPRLSGGTQSE